MNLPNKGIQHRNSSTLPSRPFSIIFFGVFGLLLLCPLLFGAVEPWSIYFLEVVSAGLIVIWLVQQSLCNELTIRRNPLFLPMLVFASLVGFQLATGKTAYRSATVSAGLLYLAYGMLCFLVVQCLTRPGHVKILTKFFSIYGLAIATFALLQGLTPNGKLYWLRTPRGGGWIYGPYVNHNHYAGLMEMLFPIPLVFSLTAFAKRGPRRLAILASAVMATTIFLSGSRGGMISLGCELLLLLAILILQKDRVPGQGKLAFALFVVILVALLAGIGGRKATERLTNTNSARNEMAQGLRLQIDKDLLRMFPHRPWIGWGLGTFADVYPEYRSFYTTFYLDEAHNDYLQLLIETGLAGFILMIWFLWLVFRASARKLPTWQTNIDGSVTLAAVLGVEGILIHSAIDFNLQVPSNAALFYVLCTVAAMEPRFGKPDIEPAIAEGSIG